MNIPEIKAIIELFETSSLSQLKIENKDLKIELTQGGLTAQVGAAGEPAPKASKPLTPNPPQPISKGVPVKAPLPGVFYRSEAPGAKPFVEVGQKVSKGSPLCLLFDLPRQRASPPGPRYDKKPRAKALLQVLPWK